MNERLRLRHETGRQFEILTSDDRLLWRYVYTPDTPAGESPRPYVHPLYSLAGDLLTNFRPNDHPWHHGLSLTLTRVDGTNFWGGPSFRAGEGYRWREDQGTQRHREWGSLAPGRVEETLEWCEAATGRVLLRERRVLLTTLTPGGWSLQWTSELANATDRPLVLDNYHAGGGLAGSHYTGLQFRGARDLLDDHGDGAIGLTAEGGLAGEAAVHGTPARWMEWSCQHDGSLRRTRLRFECPAGPIPWFVRAKNPLAAFAFHREQPQPLAAGAVLRLDHLLTFTQA
ncbi:MAG: PmoA family protein [Verrucomicrobia bacterium]|nr:PmoA family protein [Verrucomicrobiota bacterium]